MHIRRFILVCGLFTVAATKSWAQAPFDASQLKVSWEVGENHYQGKAQFMSVFTIVNKGHTAFPAQGWQLYFNFVRSVNAGPTTGGVSAAHVNGDLYKLMPTADSKGIAAGDSIRIALVADAWAVNYTDAPDGLYFVWDKEPAKGYSVPALNVRPSTQPKQYLRFPGDKIGLITPQDIYEQNKNTADVPLAELPKVFPTPIEITNGTGELVLTPAVTISADPAFAKESAYLAAELKSVFGKEPAVTNGGNATITLSTDATLAPENYTLTVTSTGVQIKAGEGAGIFYGIQSLKSLFPANAWAGAQKKITLPAVNVKDGPRFGYRAFMIDVSRNFHSKNDIYRLLDLMAMYKLNVLHFHLTDDEGWRLEIPSLPELTTVGAHRGHTPDEKDHLQPAYGSGPDVSNEAGSGFYTKQDFIDILHFAAERHIRVIPEIETPGHARAAIVSMKSRYEKLSKAGQQTAAEEYLLSDPKDASVYRSVQNWNDNVINVALPAVYHFLDKVVEEVQGMYKEAGVPLEYVHMGGDEVPAGVWAGSPAVKTLMEKDKRIRDVNDLWYYYYGKVNDLLKKRGLKLYGWEEMGMRKTTLDGKPFSMPNPGFGGENLMVDVWNNIMGGGAEDLPYRLANANYKVVLSGVSNMYFDMAYMKSFDEPGFYWGGFVDVDKPFYFIPMDYYKNAKVDALGNPLDPAIFKDKQRLTGYGADNIVGVQGLLWSETVKNVARMEYMILPKLLGLAERAWAKDPEWAQVKDSALSADLYTKAWSSFANTLGKKELVRLSYYNGGYNYRIPTAGAIVVDGAVVANLQLPGFTIRYTANGKEPDAKSKVYAGPIKEKGTIRLKVFDAKGRASRTVAIENK